VGDSGILTVPAANNGQQVAKMVATVLGKWGPLPTHDRMLHANVIPHSSATYADEWATRHDNAKRKGTNSDFRHL